LNSHSDIAASYTAAVPRLITNGVFDKIRDVLAPELQLAERSSTSLHSSHNCCNGSVFLMRSKDVEAFLEVCLVGESDSIGECPRSVLVAILPYERKRAESITISSPRAFIDHSKGIQQQRVTRVWRQNSDAPMAVAHLVRDIPADYPRIRRRGLDEPETIRIPRGISGSIALFQNRTHVFTVAYSIRDGE